MPKTAEASKTQMEDTFENPNADNKRTIVHVTLIFDGVDFEPKELYDALDDKYEVVDTEKDSLARGTYIFRVSAE